jgi:site-specific recombinase XerD
MKYLSKQGATCVVEWERCKGIENRTSVLSARATSALNTYLHKVYGSQLQRLPTDAPVWVSFSRRNYGQAIGPRTIANMCEEFSSSSKVHTTRHTAALKMLQSGASLEDIRKFPGHKNVVTTAIYIETTLVDYAIPYATVLEDAFGI